MRHQVTFPEATQVKLPQGTLARIHEAARQDGTTAAEFMRRSIRSALKDAQTGGDGYRGNGDVR